jgi:hypothetical protein
MEIRAPFECSLCGFSAVARVVGRGSAATEADIALLPAPVAGEHVHHTARANAADDGAQLIRLMACPRCGKRDPGAWGEYQRVTRRLQMLVAAVVLAGVVALWIANPDNPAIAVLCAIPGALCVFTVGFVRGLRTEMPADRVTFLSKESLIAEADGDGTKGGRREGRAQKRQGDTSKRSKELRSPPKDGEARGDICDATHRASPT